LPNRLTRLELQGKVSTSVVTGVVTTALTCLLAFEVCFGKMLGTVAHDSLSNDAFRRQCQKEILFKLANATRRLTFK
jgi:hypothetical protein